MVIRAIAQRNKILVLRSKSDGFNALKGCALLCSVKLTCSRAKYQCLWQKRREPAVLVIFVAGSKQN